MPKRKVEKIDIDVVPYLSIMVMTLNLICLILIVVVTRIALNPHALPVMSFTGVFTSEGDAMSDKIPKIPSYIDCHPDGLELYPGAMKLSAEDLLMPRNALEKMLTRIDGNSSNEYIVLLVRPQSVEFYRKVRNMISKKKDIEVGYDVVDPDFVVNWAEQAKLLGIAETVTEK
jgi:hypothetical protein